MKVKVLVKVKVSLIMKCWLSEALNLVGWSVKNLSDVMSIRNECPSCKCQGTNMASFRDITLLCLPDSSQKLTCSKQKIDRQEMCRRK